MVIIELEEGKDRAVPPETLDERTALLIHSRLGNQIEMDFPSPLNDRQYVLRSKGYVGTIPVSDELWVRVRPDVSIGNIFRMLEYAYSLKSFRFFEGMTSVDSVDEVFDRLAVVLAERVLNRVRRGLYKGYVCERRSLPYVKGRLLSPPAFRAIQTGSLKLPCDYQTHSAEVMDNRIIVWTLYQMRRLPLRTETARLQVRKAYRAISHFLSVQDVATRDCVGRLYDRLNDDYEPIHALCRFFLDHSGPCVDFGGHRMLPFSLHMPSLFELFVAEWLKINIPQPLHLKTQYRRVLDAERSFAFRIDIVVQEKLTGFSRAVLDTKYKRSERPEVSDIMQIMAYALTMNASSAVLVYPSQQTTSLTLDVGDGMRVRSAVFDLHRDLDEAGSALLSELALTSACQS